MFNLTGDEAHTFYVGLDGWLVHNQNLGYSPVLIENSTFLEFRKGNLIAQKMFANLAGRDLYTLLNQFSEVVKVSTDAER